MLKNRLKLIVIPLLALLISFSFGSSQQAYSEANSSATVHVKVDFIGNLFFDKYDVGLCLDNQLIDSLKHGTDYIGDISTSVGEHIIWFYNLSNPDITWAGSFTTSKESTITLKIITHSKTIEVSNFEFFDDAAYKAEQARLLAEQKAKAEENERKRKFEKSVSNLKYISEADDPAVAQFVENYKGQTIELEGNVSAILSIDGIVKYLFRLGDYKSFNDKGADFIIEFPTSANSDLIDIIDEGKNVTFVGTVTNYDEKSHKIILGADSLTLRKDYNVQIPDTSSPKIIKAVQEALNEAGYECGTPDGIAGNKTYAAIADFRNDNGLSANSGIDTAVLALLRVSAPQEESKEENKPAQSSRASVSESETQSYQPQPQAQIYSSYILNKNTKKFHEPYCSSVNQMKESNKIYFEGTRQEVISRGYVPCQRCNP